MDIRLNKILLILSGFIIFDIISLLSFIYDFQNIIFILFSLFFISLAFYKIEYSLYIVLAELFIGGKGYLLSASLNGFTISLRMIIFIIFILAWAYQYFFKKGNMQEISIYSALQKNIFLAFIATVLAGFIHGIFINGFSDAFLDFNAWIFLAFIPIFITLKNNASNTILLLFTSVIAVGLKTLITLILFTSGVTLTHTSLYYKWIRDTGVGEITSMGRGAYRVFFQSHIYSLIAIIIILCLLFFGQKFQKKKAILYGTALYLGILSIIISQSRSFWVGGIATLIALIIFSFWNMRLRVPHFLVLMILIFSIIYSEISLVKIINGGIGLSSKRITHPLEEAAGASRMNQLAPLAKEIIKKPFLGYGFGKRVEYKTEDPRILKESPDGITRPYAFEWGYLDIILKIGILGLALYGAIIFFLSKKLLLSMEPMPLALLFGLIALLGVHMFTPYLNHPLGIGFILLCLTWTENHKISSNESNA